MLTKYQKTDHTPFCEFRKSVGHDINNFRALDLMREESRMIMTDRVIRRILHKDPTTHHGVRDHQEEAEEPMAEGPLKALFFVTIVDNMVHYSRDCTNPRTTCTYCRVLDHVTEECSELLKKWQDKKAATPRGNVQMVRAEDRPGADSALTIWR
jgi:hypothetical protein